MDYQRVLASLIHAPSRGDSEILTVAIELRRALVTLAAVERRPGASGVGAPRLMATARLPFDNLLAAGRSVADFIRALPPRASFQAAQKLRPDQIRLVVNFPRHQSLVRFLDLPSGDPA